MGMAEPRATQSPQQNRCHRLDVANAAAVAACRRRLPLTARGQNIYCTYGAAAALYDGSATRGRGEGGTAHGKECISSSRFCDFL
eukprot:COSAG01_NODE_2509_length_7549_cov_22.865235_2_plen_85_part_00